jgi:hypothetical protein
MRILSALAVIIFSSSLIAQENLIQNNSHD